MQHSLTHDRGVGADVGADVGAEVGDRQMNRYDNVATSLEKQIASLENENGRLRRHSSGNSPIEVFPAFNPKLQQEDTEISSIDQAKLRALQNYEYDPLHFQDCPQDIQDSIAADQGKSMDQLCNQFIYFIKESTNKAYNSALMAGHEPTADDLTFLGITNKWSEIQWTTDRLSRYAGCNVIQYFHNGLQKTRPPGTNLAFIKACIVNHDHRNAQKALYLIPSPTLDGFMRKVCNFTNIEYELSFINDQFKQNIQVVESRFTTHWENVSLMLC